MFLRERSEPVTSLPGVGPAFARAAERLGVRTVADLLGFYPRDYQDRRSVVPLSRAVGVSPSVVLVSVEAHRWLGRGPRNTLAVTVRDESGQAILMCWNRRFLDRALAPGTRHFVYGRFVLGRGGIECAAFDHEPAGGRPRAFLRLLPVYPLTEGLSQAAVRRAMAAALAGLHGFADELPESVIREAGLLPKAEAVAELHAPRDESRLEAARRTLKYEELFLLHIAVARRAPVGPARAGHADRGGRRGGSALRDELLRRLPFRLTADQLRSLGEIESSLLAPSPSTRLLQGDVGCGKTLVALLAGLVPIGNGEQVALMAPTELLARQHAENASRLLEPLGVRVAFLTGSVPEPARTLLLDALSGDGSGGVDLLVGTHALFSEGVRFRRLGFVIIDEQQRFGVAQRQDLISKGGERQPDVLLTTATPIPRTLALTVLGDIEVSEIRTMPEGRLPVSTHLAREGNEAKVYERVRTELRKGRQAYFVYPLIQESQALDVRDAERMYVRLSSEVYPEWECALIHSRVSEEEKTVRMARFVSGETRVLVATSVVEVGVDVPNATCMVVEHADRFGLSALHQLRGRVGRGNHQSFAFLVYSRSLTDAGLSRLRAMKETTDGFAIAEQDLRLRGPGAVLGVEQAGFLRLGIADLASDVDLLMETRSAARRLLAGDPGLEAPEHAVLRRVLESEPALP